MVSGTPEYRLDADKPIAGKARKAYVVLAFFGLSIIALLAFGIFSSLRIVRHYMPLVDAVNSIELEVTSAHLQFEEILSGSRNEDMDTVRRHQDQARRFADTMLEGGRWEDTELSPLIDPEMRRKVRAIVLLLSEFKAIAQKRYAAAQESGSGTGIDLQYDVLFRRLTDQSEEVETALQRLISMDLKRFKYTQAILVVVVLMLFMAIAIAFWRFDRHRTKSFDQIKDSKQALWQEIHRRELAQEMVLESERRYTRLLENAKDVIFRVVLPDGRFEYINPACTEVFGYTAEDFYRSPDLLKDLIHPDWRLYFEDKWAELLNGRPPETCEYQIIDKAGDTKWIHQKNVMAPDGKGRPSAVEAFVIDITEMKKVAAERLELERYLQQTQKLESLGTLADGLAHDFNNILMIILGNTDVAARDLSPQAPAQSYLEHITSAVKRATHLVRQILVYSGGGKMKVKPILPNDLIARMRHLFEAVTADQAVLKFAFSRDLPQFNGDEDQIRQVLINLMTNAVEALDGKEGEITISTGTMQSHRDLLNITDAASRAGLRQPMSEGVHVFIEVADTGCGMDDEVKRKLFDPFFTTKLTGRGLGLAAAQGIVRSHQGAIQVDSEPGKGTTVRVLFPAVEEDAGLVDDSESTTTAPDQPRKGQKTVLVADDEEDVLTVCRLMLHQAGLHVICARDGREALRLFKTHIDQIDCVLLDLKMPHLDGEEVFCQMRSLRPDVKVIISSGYNEHDVSRRMTCQGLSGFIQKPYTSKALLSKIKSVL